jgi:hypothetical protein
MQSNQILFSINKDVHTLNHELFFKYVYCIVKDAQNQLYFVALNEEDKDFVKLKRTNLQDEFDRLDDDDYDDDFEAIMKLDDSSQENLLNQIEKSMTFEFYLKEIKEVKDFLTNTYIKS